jgi:hypothetical protein
VSSCSRRVVRYDDVRVFNRRFIIQYFRALCVHSCPMICNGEDPGLCSDINDTISNFVVSFR